MLLPSLHKHVRGRLAELLAGVQIEKQHIVPRAKYLSGTVSASSSSSSRTIVRFRTPPLFVGASAMVGPDQASDLRWQEYATSANNLCRHSGFAFCSLQLLQAKVIVKEPAALLDVNLELKLFCVHP